MVHHPRIAFAVVAACSVLGLFAACGTDAVGVGACRQVESARCVHAAACGIDLTLPVHADTPQSNADACVRYYHEQCLHGLETPTDPGAVAVKACVDTINAGDCAVVKTPETAPACAWLIPPAQVDASVIDAADAADE